MMKLFAVYNGWMGNGEIHVLVLAETRDSAQMMAIHAFQEEATRRHLPEKYSQVTEVIELAPDASVNWVGQVEE
jgi:hypothetical protein